MGAQGAQENGGRMSGRCYEVISKRVVIEAECPGEINRVENLFI